jgi:hypothetical protein
MAIAPLGGWFSATFVVWSILAIFIGCARHESNGSMVDGENQHILGDPVIDADSAIKRSDYHLVGVQRFVVVVPGVNAYYELLSTRFEISIIDGTSDVFVRNQPNSFNTRTELYAVEYNKRVFSALGCDLVKPMDPCKAKE